MDKGDIGKTIHERMLVDATCTKQLVGTRMSEFGIKKGLSDGRKL